ncbi:uncharacterized protein LOC135711852 [Ochlerotatus camptorhynchus]|uniref:uncharacterized protein LOC135711852 n=1 Tax=Ochlerotatus camptorhynchus TaxID=644619 RepID=UPI0031E4816B
MGLKLKWFRRRITFEGIPSAPERSIRRKEQNSGITVIGVYRQSVNFEDYIEPSPRASHWEPPSQPIATTTIRKPNTSTTSSTIANKSSSSSAKYGVGDKIASREHNNGRIVETPPEPNYSPPKPPGRQGLSKTKSTPNVSVLDGVSTKPTSSRTLEVTRSVEVLNEVTVDKREVPVTPAPRNAGINYNVKVENEKEQAVASIEKVEGETSEQWKQQQPEFFNEILEKVNVLANTTKPVKTDYGDETESFDDIFEKVKAKPRLLAEKKASPKPETKMSDSFRDSSSSIEDIFEPRPPELMFLISMDEQIKQTSTPQEEITLKPTEPRPIQSEAIPRVESSSQINYTDTAADPLKSILKKRAPAPPHSVELTVTPSEIPTPPPRTIRKQPTPDDGNDDDDDDGDDYLNWNMVERHRSSITLTVATQKIDAEIMRNVPVSLQQTATTQTKPFLNTRALLDEEPLKTLRGMRNRRPTTDGGMYLGIQGHSARNSQSNGSEASA